MKIYEKLKKYIRGDIGKIILGLPMIKYFIFGVDNYKKKDSIKLYLLDKIRNPKFNVEINNNNIKGFFETKGKEAFR